MDQTSGPSGACAGGAASGPAASGDQRKSLVGTNGNPYDINGTYFNSDLFIQKIIKEYSLNKLMETESSLIKQIQDLDSDMQTLVYENYNKFILATNSIRKMKTDFREMEDKMALLSRNIALITENSTTISESLKEKRDEVNRLSGIHDLLKKLKFLFELPNRLKQHLEEKNYDEAVKCYINGIEYLNEFKGFPSLKAIKEDCLQILDKIRENLYKDFDDQEVSSQELAKTASLLLSIGESSITLGERFLENALPKLSENLNSLRNANIPNVEIEEFMELGCGIFLSNLSLVIASFTQSFIQIPGLKEDIRLESQDSLKVFVDRLMDEFMSVMEMKLIIVAKKVVPQSKESREEYIKALDRLYRRLMAMGTLTPNTDYAELGLELISKLTKLDAELCLNKIQTSFEKAVKDSCTELRSQPGSSQEILGSILTTLILQIKSSLNQLQDFCRPDYQFSQNSEFRQKMAAVTIREELVVASFKYLIQFGDKLKDSDQYDTLTWLLIAKLYLDIEIGTVEYMLNSVEADFDVIRDKGNTRWKLTSASSLATALNATAKSLVREFVASQGNQIAELMKKAILAKDLTSLTEDPDGPQHEMKQFIEILTKLEKHVDSIFPDQDNSSYLKSEKSSDSSRRSYSTLPGTKNHQRQQFWSNIDPNMATNIQKLFSEKVEVFGQVELQKSDIMMAVVKIGLRALLECVRKKVLGKFGLHQIQVDTHYLQLYLWKFVNNESFLFSLLDEILASSLQRCVNPSLLESVMVETLAEKSSDHLVNKRYQT